MVSNRMRLATLFVLITLAVSTTAMGTFASQHTAEEEASQATTYLRVAHFGPDAPAVDVYLDNETVATNASFGDVTPYLAVHAGTYNVSITAAGDNTTVLHEQTVTLEPRAVLTVAASGELADDQNRTFGLNVYSDDALHPGPNSSALRIVHLSPDAGAVTLTVDNGSTTLAENLTTGETGDYLSIAPGNYTIEIREANGTGNGTVLATANVSVNASEAVTAWAVGYTDPMTDQQPFTVATTEDAVASIILPTAETPTPNATAIATTPTETETETVPTGTETATETAPTATETGTESEPTGTETGTETESTPTETETESEPTGTETESSPTETSPTETETTTEPTGTETVPTITLP